jgi:hypothetical protein
MADLAAADAELARRFTVPKQFLIANRATYSFYTAFLGRVGRPGELAPIVEAPGGGYLRRPGHDATLRAWTGRVSAAGRQLTDTISGEYTWTIDDSPSARRVFAFWHDLHRPRW